MSAIPKLLLDIGNSRIKWATSHPYCHQGSFVWKAHELEGLLQSYWHDLQQPEAIYIASVVPSISQQLMDWTLKKWNVEPVFQESGTAFNGLNNGYDLPKTLGIDRWLAMCHVWQTYHNSAIVVDVGSGDSWQQAH